MTAVRWHVTFLRNASGATAIEYALLAAMVAIACILSLLAFQGSMADMFGYIESSIVPLLSGS